MNCSLMYSHCIYECTGDVSLEQQFKLPAATKINDDKATMLSLKEIVARLQHAYCGHIGVEYMFINERWAWLQCGCGYSVITEMCVTGYDLNLNLLR